MSISFLSFKSYPLQKGSQIEGGQGEFPSILSPSLDQILWELLKKYRDKEKGNRKEIEMQHNSFDGHKRLVTVKFSHGNHCKLFAIPRTYIFSSHLQYPFQGFPHQMSQQVRHPRFCGPESCYVNVLIGLDLWNTGRNDLIVLFWEHALQNRCSFVLVNELDVTNLPRL